MKRKLALTLLASTLLAVTYPVQANLQSEMNSWFDSSGYGNATAPGVYKSQLGGYYSGGSVSMRVPTRSVGGFVSYQPPSFKGGCGGIDLDLGGFNLVNKDEIVQQLRAIGQNAKALAFTMAIKYISSLLGSTMETVKGFADTLNKTQLDSCEAASALLGAAGDQIGKIANKEKEGCIQVKVARYGLTYDQARTSCTTGGDRGPTNDAEKNQRFFTEGNLAWFNMMQVPWLKNDLEMAEILMNLTGTTILYPKGTGNEEVKLPVDIGPMAIEGDASMQAFLDTMVFGSEVGGFKGKVQMVRCDSPTSDEINGCSTLKDGGKPQDFDLSTYTSIKTKVVDRIKGIYSKVYDKDAVLSDEEKALIETVAAPIYRYILVTASAFHRTNPTQDFMLDEYLNGIAKDIIATNLLSMTMQIKLHTRMEKTNGGTDEQKQKYADNLDKVNANLQKVKEESIEKVNYILAMHHEAQKYERIVVGRLSPGTLSASMFMQ